MCVCWLLSHVQFFATPWTVPHQAPLSMGFSRPEYWMGLPFASPGNLPYLGNEPCSPALQEVSLPFELQQIQQGRPLPSFPCISCFCLCVCGVFLCLHRTVCRISVPWLGIQPGPLAEKVLSPNDWTTQESPVFCVLREFSTFCQPKEFFFSW